MKMLLQQIAYYEILQLPLEETYNLMALMAI